MLYFFLVHASLFHQQNFIIGTDPLEMVAFSPFILPHQEFKAVIWLVFLLSPEEGRRNEWLLVASGSCLFDVRASLRQWSIVELLHTPNSLVPFYQRVQV